MLENVKIARPCGADWEKMTGDDRVRFCNLCQLSVYNLSGMKREEAEALLASKTGKMCVRLYERADGTVITEDCPVGLAAVKRRIATVAASALALLATGCGWFARSAGAPSESVIEPVVSKPAPAKPAPSNPSPVEPPPHVRMGQVCIVDTDTK